MPRRRRILPGSPGSLLEPRRIWRAGFVGILVFLGLLISRPATANPDLRLRTLETEHFIIHYPANAEEVADRSAMLAERAYERLTHLLAHEPALRTHIIIDDGTDNANGFANAVPFPRSTIFAVAPGTMSVLGSYDDWLDVLITHEFVHVVHLDTVHGLPRLINALLGFGVVGKVSAPNGVQPRWIVEGIATMYESDLGSQGRYHSALFTQFLRMAVLENRFQQIDRVTNNARVFPHGSSVYLYGLHFMRYIFLRYGRDKFAELSHIYGSRVIPLGINRALEDVIGVGFDQLWDDFRVDTTRRFRAQARQIRARGLRQGRRLTVTPASAASGQHTRYPFWSPDDAHIYFYDDDGHRQAGIRRIAVTGSRIREGIGFGNQGQTPDIDRVLDVEDSTQGSFIGPNEDQIVFDMISQHDLRYRWSDLYRWKGPNRRGREQLTFGKRAREPDVSPDGRTVAFARNDIGQSRLAFLELDTLEVTEVEPNDALQQVYQPKWSPDGTKVVYSGWAQGGFRDIYVYDRTQGLTERLTASRFMDTAPDWSPDGRYIVFASDRNDVFNIHAYDTKTEELFQVTNVLGGAYEPALSHDGTKLAYVGYTSTGYDVWLMDFEPERFLTALPDTTSLRPAADPTPEIDAARGRPPTANSSRYKAWKTFFPRTLFPGALEFENADFLSSLSLTTQISDVFSWHVLGARYTYVPEFREHTGSVGYSFNRLVPNFAFRFSRDFRALDGFRRFVYDPPPDSDIPTGAEYLVEGYRERSTLVSGEMSVPVLQHTRHGASFQVGYRWLKYQNVDAGDDVVDPNAPASRLPETGDLTSISVGFEYDNREGVRYGYQSETGRRLDVELEVIDEALGGDYGDVQFEGSYTEMLRMPWVGHQVLAMRLEGGVSAGGIRRRGAFSVGGFPEDQDVMQRLLTRAPFFESGVLRGYNRAAFRGRYKVILNTEYRMPVLDIERGVGSVPIFVSRIVLAAFTDWGLAWTDPIAFKDLMGSVGGSVIFDFSVGYGERISLFFQYARGFDVAEGTDYFRAYVARSF